MIIMKKLECLNQRQMLKKMPRTLCQRYKKGWMANRFSQKNSFYYKGSLMKRKSVYPKRIDLRKLSKEVLKLEEMIQLLEGVCVTNRENLMTSYTCDYDSVDDM